MTTSPAHAASRAATSHPSGTPTTGARALRRRRRWALGGSVVCLALGVSGCSFATDTPLHVVDVARAVTPGQGITGKVGYPDGRITVTLAPAASPVRDGHRTRGETSCDYGRLTHRFTCPTADLATGLYLVQVTDAGQPGEGTAEAQVAITDAPGYDPHLVAGDGSETAPAGPLRLRLTGWRPGVTVRIALRDENGTTSFTGSVVPDEQGSATVTTTPLEAGHHDIEATDGLGRINGDEGAYNDAYSGIEIS